MQHLGIKRISNSQAFLWCANTRGCDKIADRKRSTLFSQEC
ncbi:TPA: hypothetical protein N0F65_006157 [Lagenidium giganteum]|uniref:Uncharacterized protein n=1 Tax=Lagenidium giganteum TaxID=4803 RepID=A0AAV2Z9F5_9STRA|nr:TPA: hypothetical protein N0F65_006157 [Lagenidium giganteum]